jgi:hypothetical protein
MWTLAFGHHEDRTPTHGYAETREAAMAAFAKSWRRDAGCKSATAQTGQIQPLWLFNLALEDASPDQIHRRARSCSAFSAAYMAP